MKNFSIIDYVEFKVSYNNIDSALKASRMFNLQKQHMFAVMSGEYKNAVKVQRELAKEAVQDFETYKSLPILNFKNIPFKDSLQLIAKIIKYRLFRLFTFRTPEEKEFKNLCHEYKKELTPEEIRKKTIDITIPSLF